MIVHLTAELPHSGEALNIGDKVTLWIHATVYQVEDDGVDVSKVNERLGRAVPPPMMHEVALCVKQVLDQVKAKGRKR